MFCSKCGSELPEGTKFCPKCGNPIESATSEPEAVQPSANEAIQATEEAVPDETAPVKEESSFFDAAATTGETVLSTFGGNISGAVSNIIPGPAKVIASGVKSFASSIKGLFTDPKAMIPALALAAVWLILNILQAAGINPLPTKIMSFLTFANGGMTKNIPAAIGGIIGKGAVAGALTALVGMFTKKNSGEKRSLTDTLKGAFGFSMDTIGPYLLGAGIAVFIYIFISGGDTKMGFVAGLSAAFLSAKAALSNGFLSSLFASLTSKGKEKAGPGAAAFIRGAAAGFAAGAIAGFPGIKIILYILGGLLAVGGIVLTILTMTGTLKNTKGAA